MKHLAVTVLCALGLLLPMAGMAQDPGAEPATRAKRGLVIGAAAGGVVGGLAIGFLASGLCEYDCDRAFEGYAGMLHGGVIASLLDGAMTNCMFANGIPAITAELTIRFRHPVVIGRTATVRAWIERSSPPLHRLRAEVVQDEQRKATAFGKFMERADSVARTHHTRRIEPDTGGYSEGKR